MKPENRYVCLLIGLSAYVVLGPIFHQFLAESESAMIEGRESVPLFLPNELDDAGLLEHRNGERWEFVYSWDKTRPYGSAGLSRNPYQERACSRKNELGCQPKDLQSSDLVRS